MQGMPPNPMSVPQNNRQTSYQQDPYSSISTTPNPLTPLDMPQFGSAPMASPFSSFSHQSTSYGGPGIHSSMPSHDNTAASPWMGSVPSQSAAQSPVDWSSPSMSWLFPAGQTAGPEEAENNIMNSLAELLQEEQSKGPSPQEIDAMLQSAFQATQTQTPPNNIQTPPALPQQASLLSRQMQQQQQAFNGGPLSRTNSGRSFQSTQHIPTPPQSFGSSFPINTSKPNMSLWPLPDRANVYNDTPVTTPGGSDMGYNASPIEVSWRSDRADYKPSSGPSRMQPQPLPNRRAAPQQSNAFGSFSSSPTVPIPNPLSGAQTPPNWPPGMSLSGLPPLPPGLSIAHLAEYGQFGLEMAIRMGMGIGMGLGQQAMQQQEQSQPSSDTQSPISAPTKKRSGTIRPQAGPSTSVRTASDLPSVPAEGSKSTNVVSNILNDNFFAIRSPTSPPVYSFPSVAEVPNRAALGSPEPGLTSPVNEAADPLATQVWKAYAKAKDGLPNGPRMENLTWRLMHLTLKKQEEEQAAGLSKSAGTSRGFQAGSLDTVKEEKSGNSPAAEVAGGGEIERGRSKGKSRVVGFQNAASPQDPVVEDG